MADITVEPDVLGLGLGLRVPSMISSFPAVSRTPSHNFSDEKADNAVLVNSTESGYPVLNKQFTFDPRIFNVEYRSVSQADKETIMTFYENHKDLTFPWYNIQDSTWYEVCFISKPSCRMDGRKDLWRLGIELCQTSSE